MSVKDNEEFESWIKAEHPNLYPNVPYANGSIRTEGGHYHNRQLNMMWDAWKTSRELMINTPQLIGFMEAVKKEAMHQRERWGRSHDPGKTDEDWLFLIGFLGGKAVQAGKTASELRMVTEEMTNDMTNKHYDDRLHRIIAVAAVALNWHARHTGEDTTMRPGIGDPHE